MSSRRCRESSPAHVLHAHTYNVLARSRALGHTATYSCIHVGMDASIMNDYLPHPGIVLLSQNMTLLSAEYVC